MTRSVDEVAIAANDIRMTVNRSNRVLLKAKPTCYTDCLMALPLRKAESQPREVEAIFRPVRDADGKLRIVKLPATLENLLHPRLEDQLTQSNDHLLVLVPLFDALKRYLTRLAPNLAVFSDLMLLYGRHGYRDVSPDIAIVEGLPQELVDAHNAPGGQLDSLDVIAEGGRLRLVLEVVSTSTADMRRKDEVDNPRLFAALGVDDHVLVYPPEPGRPLSVVAKRLAASGRYRPTPPGPQGWILLRSVGLRLRVDEESARLVLEHLATGERLLSSQEEEAERRAEKRRAEAAERRAEETERRAEEAEARGRAESLLEILDVRGFSVDAESRNRILGCRDSDQLVRWTRQAFTLEKLDDLWSDS